MDEPAQREFLVALATSPEPAGNLQKALDAGYPLSGSGSAAPPLALCLFYLDADMMPYQTTFSQWMALAQLVIEAGADAGGLMDGESALHFLPAAMDPVVDFSADRTWCGARALLDFMVEHCPGEMLQKALRVESTITQDTPLSLAAHYGAFELGLDFLGLQQSFQDPIAWDPVWKALAEPDAIWTRTRGAPEGLKGFVSALLAGGGAVSAVPGSVPSDSPLGAVLTGLAQKHLEQTLSPAAVTGPHRTLRL